MCNIEKIDTNIINSVYGGFSEMKSEIVLNVQVKTIIEHHKNDDLDKLTDVMFEEIQNDSKFPAENWKMLDYKILTLGE